jgi:hypothetical protein
MNITAHFSHTAKSRAILNAYNEAEILGNFRECFITGQETTEFHTYYLNTPEGRIYRRVYLNLPYMPNSKMVELIEAKMNADLRNELDYST